jgi:MFS transporter, DHA1 family, multidrug resistance protein
LIAVDLTPPYLQTHGAAELPVLRDDTTERNALRLNSAASVSPSPTIGNARLAVVLGLLTTLGPLTIDMYLPALPAIADQLKTSDNAIQWTLTGTMLGVAVGQLIVGPLSDRFGRRRPLIAALFLHVLMSVVCAIAPTIEVLMAARAVQGLGASAGAVVALAIIRDLYTGLPAARLMARMMLITGIAPVLAPSLGSVLLRVTNWHGLFAVLAGIGAVLALLATLKVPETNPVHARQSGGIGTSLRTYAGLIQDRRFLGLCLAAGLGMTVIMAYVSGSSFVLQQQFGFSTTMFGVVFAVNALGLIAASQLNPVLLRRFNSAKVLRTGLTAAGIFALVMVVLTQFGIGGVWGLLVPLFLTLGTAAVALPNISLLALASKSRNAGTAAAMLGASQAAMSAALSPLVGIGGTVTASSIAVVILGAAAAALIVVSLVTRTTQEHQAPVPALEFAS